MIERIRYLENGRRSVDYPESGIRPQDIDLRTNRAVRSSIVRQAIEHGLDFVADNNLDVHDTYAGLFEAQTGLLIPEDLSLGRVLHLGRNQEDGNDRTQVSVHALGEIGLRLFMPDGPFLLADSRLSGPYGETQQGDAFNCNLVYRFTSDDTVKLTGMATVAEHADPSQIALWRQLRLDAVTPLEANTTYLFDPKNQQEAEPLGGEQTIALLEYIESRLPDAL